MFGRLRPSRLIPEGVPRRRARRSVARRGLAELASRRRRDVPALMAARSLGGTDTRARGRCDGTATRPVGDHNPFSVTRTLTVESRTDDWPMPRRKKRTRRTTPHRVGGPKTPPWWSCSAHRRRPASRSRWSSSRRPSPSAHRLQRRISLSRSELGTLWRRHAAVSTRRP